MNSVTSKACMKRFFECQWLGEWRERRGGGKALPKLTY